jgi:hypothetical protein
MTEAVDPPDVVTFPIEERLLRESSSWKSSETTRCARA